MCFNWQVSLLTFFIGIIFSILLIYKGNKKYINENIVTGIFFIFISFIQFMEFIFWIDINNKIGINKIATILGPILNVCQPTILYLIKFFYYKLNIFKFNMIDLIVFSLNILYFIYFIIIYIKFISTEKLVTTITIENNHLRWPWIKYSNLYFYLILLTINILYLFNFNYALFVAILTIVFLLISIKYFKYNVGELWCFFGAFEPLIIYFSSFYIL